MFTDKQIAYVDSITINYRVYNEQKSGARHTGQFLGSLEVHRDGEYFRHLSGEQQRGETAILPSALQSLVTRLPGDISRVRHLIDASPFSAAAEDEDDD